ncbi:terminal uridylyltransferase Tailor-like [Chrysoperla carnea]|uniref:terminal uridylyltransferase Tailor-like n=1 Tax=Chrysoperla carnea TaxID=189513 RepID=UPI001D0759BB|nr:terminal uridylyltransferase Tailor-like [Chrysoperla carnea]
MALRRIRSKQNKMGRELESKVIFIDDNSLNLYPGTNSEVIYRCDECNYEIEIFNENLVLSWQMHIQETYHFETLDRERELLEQMLEREQNGTKSKEKNKKGRRNRRNGKSTADDESEERWSRRRVLVLNETNYSDEYKNLSQPKFCKNSDVHDIFDMFPSVELINKWGHEEVMKAEKEKLKDQSKKIVLESLENIIKEFYPKKFTIKLFGSRVTGLATGTTNDMDVFIDTDGELTNDENAQDEFLCKLNKFFLNNCHVINMKKIKKNKEIAKYFDEVGYPLYGAWGAVVYIKNTRTPIIKAKNKKCDMSCDISVKSGLSVINTELLKSLFHHLPIMRQIILILRLWFKNWPWSKKFTNYAISLMTLFYLQNEKVLPSVHKINQKCVKLKNEAGWPVYDYSTHEEFKKLKINQEQMSLTEHLYKFFKFYAKFNFETDVICPYMGHSVNRLNFQNDGLSLPIEMVDYKNFVSNPNKEECLYDTPIVLQDPIEQCHNVTRNIQKYELQKFKTMAELTCLVLGDRVLKSVTLES